MRIPVSTREGQPSLARVLGVWSAVSIVIGTVIGSGVFLVPSSMIRSLGSVKALFVVWLVAGVLSLLELLLTPSSLLPCQKLAANMFT